MKPSTLARLCAVIALAALASVARAGADDTVRQTRRVVVDGRSEEWQLKWAGPTTPVCGSASPSTAATCPCSGFAYGEQGHLYLERKGAGAAVERMALAPLFADAENPAADGNAALQHWPRAADDPVDDSADEGERHAFAARVALRPPTDAMDLQDFAHDGAKTAFLLQTGDLPCGKRTMVLIGVSKAVPHLHAFTTAAHPERPLVLLANEWMALLNSDGHATVTDWSCGDHGSDTATEKVISARHGEFTVRSTTYACRADGKRGALLDSEEQ